MALQSPGVQVTVIDESVYTSAEAGTTPLIVVATAQNKTNASNTGVAQGTLKANAGKAYRISSQRELVDFFGTPIFKKTSTGGPVHAGEQNEYGLQAAYSFLGVSNTVYVVRADVDLNELTPRSDEPGSDPVSGQWWLDTASTAFGIFEWDASAALSGGQRFVNKRPIVLTLDNADDLTDTDETPAPKASVGKVGDYAVVASSSTVRIFYKGQQYGSGTASWQVVGSQVWRRFFPTFEASFNNEGSEGTITIVSGDGEETLVTVPAGTNAGVLASTINGLGIDGVFAVGTSNNIKIYSTGSGDVSSGEDSSGVGYIQLLSGSLNISSIFKGANGEPSTVGATAGDYYVPDLQISPHTQVPQWRVTGNQARPTGSVWVKATDPNNGARWRVKRWNDSTKLWVERSAPLYANGHSAIRSIDATRGGAGIPQDTVYIQYNYEEDTGYDATPQTATFKVWVRRSTSATSITSDTITNQVAAGTYTLTLSESVVGGSLSSPVTITVVATGAATDAGVIQAAINGAGLTYVEATVAAGKLTIRHSTGGDIRIGDADGLFEEIGLTTETLNLYEDPSGVYDYIASNWLPLSEVGYEASNTSPTNAPANGQLWYSSRNDQVDIMVHNGTTWVGYGNVYGNTDPNGPIISAVRPERFSDGSTAINADADGQLWISTADIDNYPTIYRWNGSTLKWDLLDKTDQSSENGVLFADARYGASGATGDVAADIPTLWTNNYLDPDAPEPTLYPQGMILWNTRRSGFNVKRFAVNYINTDLDNARQNGESMVNYARNRWVTASSNQEDGSGSFGRKAQRKIVVERLKALVDTNQEIREEESRNFNLIACPGYSELLSNLVALNIDRGTTAFVVGDTPFSLASDATSLTSWGNNSQLAQDNGDKGLITADPYAAIFYPSGRTTDNTGSEVVVPPSHMMLRTIALSDQASYPWFAPAGTRRGGITNATAVGYVDRTEGEFRVIALSEGQRDAMQQVKMNPITFFNGVGLVNYGQKTLSPISSALDRINVARLVVYLRSQLNKLAKPYLFEPNDKITRDEIRQAVESLMLELVGLRAIYDYAVVCDESNNTPARIDRNELYVDIAIEPVKAVEFIYIPLRLKNTGEIQGSL
jgi:hypothetical protein